MKLRWKLLILPPLLGICGILCLYMTSLSYGYCLVMERMWMKAKTKEELESRLFAFYQCDPIDPALTVWNRTPLEEGQQTLRYLIFGKERLDVVVREDGVLVSMFAAYE